MTPTRIGQRVPGGYFTGVNRINNNAYAIVVAHKSTESSGLSFKTSSDSIVVSTSCIDGFSNSHIVDKNEYPKIQYCCSIVNDGCADFYAPSKNELELCYRYLKPSGDITQPVNVVANKLNGVNTSSIPPVSNYITYSPLQTLVITFQANNAEAFSNRYYWSCTEFLPRISRSVSTIQHFSCGRQHDYVNTLTGSATNSSIRPIRRLCIV